MKIIHISDLHFGTQREELIQLLLDDINNIKPELVVISGDLTQRATQEQYLAVKNFISKIKTSILCVPGNHDIPLYNLPLRLLFPFNNYKKWISPTLCSDFKFQNVVFLGINSVTPYKPMGGYITEQQLNMVCKYFLSQPKNSIKVVVMHHNLIRSERHKIINDAERIINVFAKAGVNLVLSGHIHFPCIELLKRNYLAHNMYVITAGTAISTRTAAPNSYNVIDFHDNKFKLTVRDFINDEFVTVREDNFST